MSTVDVTIYHALSGYRYSVSALTKGATIFYYCYARYSKSSTVEVPSNTVFSRSRVSTQVAINE